MRMGSHEIKDKNVEVGKVREKKLSKKYERNPLNRKSESSASEGSHKAPNTKSSQF